MDDADGERGDNDLLQEMLAEHSSKNRNLTPAQVYAEVIKSERGLELYRRKRQREQQAFAKAQQGQLDYARGMGRNPRTEPQPGFDARLDSARDMGRMQDRNLRDEPRRPGIRLAGADNADGDAPGDRALPAAGRVRSGSPPAAVSAVAAPCSSNGARNGAARHCGAWPDSRSGSVRSS
jgi:hypothetical protein